LVKEREREQSRTIRALQIQIEDQNRMLRTSGMQAQHIMGKAHDAERAWEFERDIGRHELNEAQTEFKGRLSHIEGLSRDVFLREEHQMMEMFAEANQYKTASSSKDEIIRRQMTEMQSYEREARDYFSRTSDQEKELRKQLAEALNQNTQIADGYSQAVTAYQQQQGQISDETQRLVVAQAHIADMRNLLAEEEIQNAQMKQTAESMQAHMAVMSKEHQFDVQKYHEHYKMEQARWQLRLQEQAVRQPAIHDAQDSTRYELEVRRLETDLRKAHDQNQELCAAYSEATRNVKETFAEDPVPMVQFHRLRDGYKAKIVDLQATQETMTATVQALQTEIMKKDQKIASFKEKESRSAKPPTMPGTGSVATAGTTSGAAVGAEPDPKQICLEDEIKRIVDEDLEALQMVPGAEYLPMTAKCAKKKCTKPPSGTSMYCSQDCMEEDKATETTPKQKTKTKQQVQVEEPEVEDEEGVDVGETTGQETSESEVEKPKTKSNDVKKKDVKTKDLKCPAYPTVFTQHSYMATMANALITASGYCDQKEKDWLCEVYEKSFDELRLPGENRYIQLDASMVTEQLRNAPKDLKRTYRM